MKIANINVSNNLAWEPSRSNNWAHPASLNTYLNGTYYNGLNSTAKSQIVAHDWGIGAVTSDNNDLATQISNENSNKWNGKIALPTVSEYIRTNSNKNSNQNSCGTLSLINDNYRSCVRTGWMNTTSVKYWWTLSPYSGDSSYAFIINDNGYVSESFTNYANRAVRPSVYLSSDIKITSGTGTATDPYQLSL